MDWGLGSWIGDSDWEFGIGLGIGIGEWDWELGFGIELGIEIGE